MPECAAVGVAVGEAEERMVTEDVCLTGTHNTLVRLTSTCGRWKEEASRNGEWKQFVVDG